MKFVIGVDTGGTFTDCVAVGEDGSVAWDKAHTTPQDHTLGILEAIGNTSARLGLSRAQLLSATVALGIGSTVGLNALLARAGAKTGLLTTRGHEDNLFIGRIHQKVAGLGEEEIKDVARLEKAAPLVPRSLVCGINERVDYKGAVLAPLNLQEVEAAVGEMARHGVESLAVCFLWSFMNATHERAVRDLVENRFPGVFVTVSSEVAPLLGEYERTATTVINANLGPIVARFMGHLVDSLRSAGFIGPVLAMHSLGGVIPCDEAGRRAAHIMASGPVGGVMGAISMGRTLGHKNIIVTDVGGTSFDVGLIVDGRPTLNRQPVFEKFTLAIPMIDVVSIGAGGGSIAWVDPQSRLLQVGPRSAGALPGPACYAQGGNEPTVTDANLVLGRIDAHRFFGGRKTLDFDLARKTIEEKVARPLGMDLHKAAKGILEIVDSHMADLVRRVTVEQGYHPSDFVIYAYGGGGPLHVGSYARDIGVSEVLVSPYAPVFSGFGIAGCDIQRQYTRSHPMTLPAPGAQLDAIFGELEADAMRDAVKSAGELQLERFLDMKFRRQVHNVRIPVKAGELNGQGTDALMANFEAAYEKIYGKGTAYRKAGVEVSNFVVTATTKTYKPKLREEAWEDENTSRARIGERQVYFDGFIETPVFSMELLCPGNRIAGPAVIESSAATLLLHPQQTATVDRHCNLVLQVG
ncbi:MAG TPA: hydantoinase/oxoprolinase family protein [Candidatus Binatia bacterium]|nr:hydantoinase/oxoprolinase family protein [Candidatus Binatia bacterium]